MNNLPIAQQDAFKRIEALYRRMGGAIHPKGLAAFCSRPINDTVLREWEKLLEEVAWFHAQQVIKGLREAP